VSALTWGEVTKWAKERGYKISRKDGVFVWVDLNNSDKTGTEKSLDSVATAVFNEISGHKWVEYQKKYAADHR
jgi:hypothetical protein